MEHTNVFKYCQRDFFFLVKSGACDIYGGR